MRVCRAGSSGTKDFEKQKWFDLYKTAMLELERGTMTGRIGDARTEIAVRLEILKEHPNLHNEEQRAIQDALNNLSVLEREEAWLTEEDRKHILRDAAQNLKAIEPKLKSVDLRQRSPDNSGPS